MDIWKRRGLKPRLADRKMGDGKIGVASEWIFPRLQFLSRLLSPDQVYLRRGSKRGFIVSKRRRGDMNDSLDYQFVVPPLGGSVGCRSIP